jgi:hypothetical protein
MKNYTFEELEKGKLYQDCEGYYIFKGMRNEYIAEFEEVQFDYNDEIVKTGEEIYRTKTELRFE